MGCSHQELALASWVWLLSPNRGRGDASMALGKPYIVVELRKKGRTRMRYSSDARLVLRGFGEFAGI